MRAVVFGLTKATITLNQCGVILHGEENHAVSVNSVMQRSELENLERYGLIRVEYSEVKAVEPKRKRGRPRKEKTEEPKAKRKRGRPKGSTKVKPAEEPKVKKKRGRPKKQKEVIEAADQEETIATVSIGAKTITRKMVKQGDDDPSVSHKVAASLKALEDMEREEREREEQSRLEEEAQKTTDIVNEQVGRMATIGGCGGETQQVPMTPSAVPDSDIARNRSPFIDIHSGEELEHEEDEDAPADDFIEI